jgi:hypothetical protein
MTVKIPRHAFRVKIPYHASAIKAASCQERALAIEAAIKNVSIFQCVFNDLRVFLFPWI